jgi:hypothetical protein
VLSEDPMRVGATLMLARALVMGRHLDRAVDLLGDAVPRHPDHNDLRLRLGEYALLAGNTTLGRSILLELMYVIEGRGSGEAQYYLEIDAATSGDQKLLKLLADALETHGGASGHERGRTELMALWAFCRGSWADEALDPGPRAWAIKELDVFRLWAALHRGRATADVAAGAKTLAENPEIGDLAGLLEADCLVRLGRPQRALAVAERRLEALKSAGRWRLEKHAWVPLAHRIAAAAAAAAGDPELARGHDEQARRLAPRCWYGGEWKE